jgi:hypothetical protein
MEGSRRTIVAVALAVAVLAPGGTAVAATTLTAKLSGQAEVPKAGDGSGTARITLKGRKKQICFNITLQNVGTTVRGHIHKGGPGVAGPIFVTLYMSATTHPVGCASASRRKIRKIRLHPRRYYVNVHTTQFPAGAARGQLHH